MNYNELPKTVDFRNIAGLTIFNNGIVFSGDGRVMKTTQINRHSKKIGIYYQIEGKNRYLNLSRIVATLFVENPNNLPHVQHLDNNPLNCHYSNLIWYDKRSVKYRIKKTPIEIEKYLRKFKVKRLDSLHLALYNHIKFQDNGFEHIMNEIGNQRYFFKIIKTQFERSLIYSNNYPLEHQVIKIRDWFKSHIYSLIERGFCLPEMDCPDAKMWIYFRTTLQGSVKAYLSNETFRHTVDNYSHHKL